MENIPTITIGEEATELQDSSSVPEVSYTKKPRALILKATNKDFNELTELVKAKFPEVQILYLTTGPVASHLRVTRVIKAPLDGDAPSENAFCTVE
jgi:hypothetical protein